MEETGVNFALHLGLPQFFQLTGHFQGRLGIYHGIIAGKKKEHRDLQFRQLHRE